MSEYKVPLPHPTEISGIVSYKTMDEFISAGGTRPRPSAERYTVTCQSAEYSDETGVRNAIEAMDSFLDLFLEGGWAVFVWDNREEIGWSYQYVGPDWYRHFAFKDLNSLGARLYRQHGLDVNQVKKKVARKRITKKLTKKKATKKATKKKVAKKATKKATETPGDWRPAF